MGDNNTILKFECLGIENGGIFPPEHTGRGEDSSPEFIIHNLSEQCNTLAITLEDLSHPIKGFTHWLIWNIPAAKTVPGAIPASKILPSLGNAKQGVAYGIHRYAGPKPPKGKTHTYQFTLYALDYMLRLVGLESAGKKKVRHFSMGMKQRLGLAIALMRKPAFLILDEPINGLDPAGIKEIRDLLLKLNQEEHVTVLISSHILGELSKIATRYGILRDGVLVEERDAEQIDAACRQYLQLTVDDVKKTEEVLSEKLCVPCTVVDSHTVCVYERLDAAEEINRAVVTSGIGLKESRFAGEDLEGYFMERMGGPSVQKGDIHA